MSTIRAKYSPQCKVTLSVEQLYEPQIVSPHLISANKLQHNLDKWAERNQLLVITAAGKPGVGSSTMINNFLDLRHDKMSPTGDDVDPMGCHLCQN
jgi:pantothenate kinase